MEQLFSCLGAVVVILLAATPFVIWDIRKSNRKIEEVFGGREELNDVQFYERYFKAQGVPFYIVKQTRQIFADEIGENLSRLSAEDDFSKELNFLLAHESDYYVGEKIIKQFGIRFSDGEAKSFYSTFDHIVNLIWRKISEKENSNQPK